MSLFRARKLRASVFLLSLALAGPAYAKEKIEDQLLLMEREVGELSITAQRLTLNFSERPNLIGSDEARDRYEEAVYLYLMREYEAAASAFYILVQARSLRTQALQQDSQWYLGDCLFEIGNLRTAADVFKLIADAGPGHPFFSDAVRRLLEVHALLGETQRFDSYYNSYIVTGRVRTTDLIVYTLAKSFRLRGERERALSTFDSVPAGSPWYSRARYFIAVMALETGDRDRAIAEFLKVEAAAPTDAATQAVFDQALLNLGALYLEAGDYITSNAYNSRLAADSPFFAEQLYQSIWAAVKQDDLGVALSQIDTFLLQFPDHRRAAPLRIVQGKLLMKSERHDDARAAFDQVVNDYGPVVSQITKLTSSTSDMQQFLSEASNDTAATVAGLPRAVVDEIRGREEVGRAVEAFDSLQEEKQGLLDAERMVGEVRTALANSGETLGTFSTARGQIKLIRAESLSIRNQLLDTEAGYIARRLPTASRPDVLAIQSERQQVVEAAVGGGSRSQDSADRLAAHDAQIREVQQRAARIQRVIAELQDQTDTLAARLRSTQLSAEDSALVSSELKRLQTQLIAANRSLAEVQADGTRRSLLAPVELSTKGTGNAEAAIASSYAALHARLVPYRRLITDSGAPGWFSRMDALWALLEAVDAEANKAESVLDGSEAREIAAVKQRLSDQTALISTLRAEILADSANIESFSATVVADGMREVRSDLARTVREGDRGVVDVYWARKLAVNQDLKQLMAAQADVLTELDLRYRILLAGLEQ